MDNFEYCFEWPFYDKQHENEYIKKHAFGNGADDITYEIEAPCLKHGFKTVPGWKCQEMDKKYIAEQTQLEMEIELLCQEKL